MNHLSSQGDNIRGKKVNNLAKKLERIKKKLKKSSIERSEKEGTAIFISESQESFVDLVKTEKTIKNKGYTSDSDEAEEQNNRRKFKKPFSNLKNQMKNRRTDGIFDLIKEEAQKQHLTTTQLLAFLMYRENYFQNRKFALEMLEVSQGKIEITEVPMNKAISIVSRAKLGKTGYNYTRRMLKPHKEGGQK